MGEKGGGYSKQNEDDHKSKIACKVNDGIYFGEVYNWWGDMVK